MSATPAPLFYATAPPGCDLALPLARRCRLTPVKGRRPVVAVPPPLSSLSPSPRFPVRMKHAVTPYTSPHYLLSEPVIGASPKTLVDIVH
jgi:hypothetical protein